MKYGTFLRKLDKGEITDLKPFLENGTAAFREEIARRGLYVEELVEKNEPTVLVSLIRHRHAQQYYEEWKTYPDKRVREELARQGHFPDEMLQDSSGDVRAAVLTAYPEKMRMVLGKSESEWYAARRVVTRNVNVTVDDIDVFLAAPKPKLGSYDYKEAYQEKRASLLHPEATVLEKTMRTYDLYKMGNPLWAKNLTIAQIATMYELRDAANEAGVPEAFDEEFEKLLSVSQDQWRARDVLRAHPAIRRIM